MRIQINDTTFESDDHGDWLVAGSNELVTDTELALALTNLEVVYGDIAAEEGYE